MKESVMILGATSAIGRAVANRFAEKKHPIFLAGRNGEELRRLASDIEIRYQVHTAYAEFQAEAYDTHENFFVHVIREMHGLEGVVVAFGELGSQEEGQRHFQEAKEILDVNFMGACSILTQCANYFESKGAGFIVGITSVAGDRGRQSNYIYGAAKGGLGLFLQGIRNRLSKYGITVLTVKPGFVDTAMTYGLPGLFLVASPERVANSIIKALRFHRNVIYTPWFWRPIMGIIRMVPEWLFKRLKL